MSNNTPSKRRSRGHDLKAINWVRDDVRGLTLYERVLLQYLASRCKNDGTHSCWPQQREIAADIEVDRRTVIRYLKSLEDKGLISKKRRPNTSCKYVLHVSGIDSLMILPEVTRNDTSGSDSLIHHKEGTISKEVEVKNLEESTAPSASAIPKGLKTESTSRGKVKILCQDYGKSCEKSAKAREAFWHRLGRIYFPDSPQYVPDHNLTHLQRQTLTRIFQDMPTTGCFVLAHVFKNWPSNGKRKTPSLSVIDEYSSTELFQSWKQDQAA